MNSSTDAHGSVINNIAVREIVAALGILVCSQTWVSVTASMQITSENVLSTLLSMTQQLYFVDGSSCPIFAVFMVPSIIITFFLTAALEPVFETVEHDTMYLNAVDTLCSIHSATCRLLDPEAVINTWSDVMPASHKLHIASLNNVLFKMWLINTILQSMHLSLMYSYIALTTSQSHNCHVACKCTYTDIPLELYTINDFTLHSTCSLSPTQPSTKGFQQNNSP